MAGASPEDFIPELNEYGQLARDIFVSMIMSQQEHLIQWAIDDAQVSRSDVGGNHSSLEVIADLSVKAALAFTAYATDECAAATLTGNTLNPLQWATRPRR